MKVPNFLSLDSRRSFNGPECKVFNDPKGVGKVKIHYFARK